MANNWKRVKVDFSTVKLGDFIEPIKTTYSELNDKEYATVYGVSNAEGICITGKEASKDISKYIILKNDCFAFNPYRINVGSIGINNKGFKGCVSPAYVVFKTKEKLNPYFLYHYLKSDYGNHLINWYGNRGGVRNALRYDDLCQIDIPDIDLPTQLILLKDIQNYRLTFDNLSLESTSQSSYLAKLRQAILQEAIEGKLTESWRKEQEESLAKNAENAKISLGELRALREKDPNYNAKALLEKIQAEKQMMFAKGLIKQEKPLLPINQKDTPFVLPEGWVWSRLGEILKNPPRNGYSPKEVNYETKVKSLKLGATTWGVFNPLEHKFIDEDIPSDSVFWLKPNDILIQRSNSIDYVGVTAIYTGKENEFIYPDLMMKLEIITPISVVYSHKVLSAPFCRDYFRNNAKGAQKSMPKINQGVVNSTIIPIPPLAEQHAIVDKVEKLLAMVDDLKKQVSERKEQSEQLMQAVLREAFEGKS